MARQFMRELRGRSGYRVKIFKYFPDAGPLEQIFHSTGFVAVDSDGYERYYENLRDAVQCEKERMN